MYKAWLGVLFWHRPLKKDTITGKQCKILCRMYCFLAWPGYFHRKWQKKHAKGFHQDLKIKNRVIKSHFLINERTTFATILSCHSFTYIERKKMLGRECAPKRINKRWIVNFRGSKTTSCWNIDFLYKTWQYGQCPQLLCSHYIENRDPFSK